MERESLTARLRAVDPLWWWLRQNFRLPSLVTIAGLVLGCGGWCYTQHADLVALKRSDPSRKLEAIDGKLSQVLQAQAAMQQRLDDFGERIESQERKWEHVEDVADAPRRHRRP